MHFFFIRIRYRNIYLKKQIVDLHPFVYLIYLVLLQSKTKCLHAKSHQPRPSQVVLVRVRQRPVVVVAQVVQIHHPVRIQIQPVHKEIVAAVQHLHQIMVQMTVNHREQVKNVHRMARRRKVRQHVARVKKERQVIKQKQSLL